MPKVFGRAIIAWNGRELQSTKDSVTFKPGLSVAKARMGPRGYVGASVMPGMSSLKCDVIVTDDFDITAMARGVEATVRVFNYDDGIEWVIAKMVLTEDPEMSEGDDSKWSLQFEGSSAEKV